MNVLIEYICAESPPPSLPYHPLKAFMDDLFLMAPDVPTAQFFLNRCICVLDWAGMTFQTLKSRSLVIEKEKIKNICPFQVVKKKVNKVEFIPSIHSNPIKFLGRVINASLTDSESIEAFIGPTLCEGPMISCLSVRPSVCPSVRPFF